MIDADRLPTGASADPEVAREIAADDARRIHARDFWRREMLDFTGRASLIAPTPYRSFAEALKNRRLRTSLPRRRHLLSAEQEKRVVQREGCLLCAREISGHLRIGDLFEALRVLEEALPPPAAVDAEELAKALLAMREYYDLVRRLWYCRHTSAQQGLSLDEALALFRQEGGLVLAPPAASFAHAPLVATVAKPACRSEGVILSIPGAARPGFNLTYGVPAGPRTELANAVDLTTHNLLVVGGLDTIVAPRAGEGDELHLLMVRAFAWVPPTHAFRKSRFYRKIVETTFADLPSGKPRSQLLNLAEGLAKVELEGAARLPAVDSLFDAVAQRLEGLLDAHHGEVRGGSIFLLAEDKGSETLNSLVVQSAWYASRQWLDTLLAHRDRRREGRQKRQLTPFVTYFRYHLGDLLFLHLLLALLPRLGRLYRSWRRAWNAPFDGRKSRFREALRASGWFGEKELRDRRLQELKRVRAFWRTMVDGKKREERQQEKWHFLGLLEGLSAGDKHPWVGKAKGGDRLAPIAAAAAKVVAVIEELELVEPLCLALEYTPVTVLQNLGIWSRPLAAAHGFERLRLAYREAVNESWPEGE